MRTALRQLGRRQREREAAPARRARAALALIDGAESGDDYAARRRLARVLDTLPDAQREALVMHHVVGMSVPELAEELGVSFDTAKSRLRLGMERLRKHYLRARDEHD